MHRGVTAQPGQWGECRIDRPPWAGPAVGRPPLCPLHQLLAAIHRTCLPSIMSCSSWASRSSTRCAPHILRGVSRLCTTTLPTLILLCLLCVQTVESAVTSGGPPGSCDPDAGTSGSGARLARGAPESAYPSRQPSQPSTPSASARQQTASAWNSPLAVRPQAPEGKNGSDDDLLTRSRPSDGPDQSVSTPFQASLKLQPLLTVKSSSAEPGADTTAPLRDAPHGPEAGPSAPSSAAQLRLQRAGSLVPVLPPAFGKSYALSAAGVQVLKITLQVSLGATNDAPLSGLWACPCSASSLTHTLLPPPSAAAIGRAPPARGHLRGPAGSGPGLQQ